MISTFDFDPLIVLVASICITIYVWQQVHRRLQIWVAFSKLPGPSYILIDLAAAFLAYSAPRVKKYPVMAVGGGPLRVVMLCNAEASKVLLCSRTQLEKASLYKHITIMVGDGVVNSKVGKWHQRRRLLTPSFHVEMLENYFVAMNEQADILVHLLEEKSKEANGTAFDICPYISRCTLDIVCGTAMNQRVNTQLETDSGYCKSIECLMQYLPRRFMVPWLRSDWIYRLTAMSKEESRAIETVDALPNKIIKNKLGQFAKSKTANGLRHQLFVDVVGKKRRLALLDMLLEMSEADSSSCSKTLTKEDIRDEVKTFLFAGSDTSYITISWTLYHIGRNPDVQQKIMDELNLVYGDSDRNSSTSDINSLKYLECVIKETLRLHPPIPVIGRHLTEEMNICGCTIPADTDVFISIYWMHRDPAHFPDPDSFNPDRFLPENSQGRHPFAFIPFSAGPRNCIGQRYAMMEVKVVLAAILRKFKVTVLKPDEISNVISVFLGDPLHGVWVQLDQSGKP